MNKFKLLLLGTAISMAPVASSAADSLAAAFEEGTAYMDARYRYEFVDQAGFSKNAKASTLRTRLGYKTGDYHGFSGLLEFEDISQIGGENYNDTVNGRTAYPVVADAPSSDVNQAYLQFAGIENTRIRIGREAINLNNQRFVGTVGWRQNDQTYDNINIVNTSLPDTTFVYGYVTQVNRIFGQDSPVGDLNTSSHIVHVINDSLPIGTINAYGYFLDIDEASSLSSKTYGISLDGKQQIGDGVWFKYYAEYARQSDHGNNAINYDANYYHISPAIAWNNFTLTAGYEVLGSDNGVIGFSTPLATLHRWNGWADMFLSTPANGLEDIYGKIDYTVSGVGEVLDGTKLTVVYHDFSADEGSADYGDEWDFNITQNFAKHYSVGLKYASYDADSFGVDTDKLILSLGFKFNQPMKRK